MSVTSDEAEIKRISVLHSLKVMDSEPDIRYDRIADVAARICQCEIGTITFVDSNRTWFKSKFGTQLSEIPRSESFCNETIKKNEVLIVNDALNFEQFKNLYLVKNKPNIRFYAGAPIFNQGQTIGTVCVYDSQARELMMAQKEALSSLAAQVSRFIELKHWFYELVNGKTDQTDLLLIIEGLQEELIYSSLYSTFYNMATGIQHEINNPLAIVVGRMNLLKKNLLKKTPEEIEKEIDTMLAATQRVADASKLINLFPY